MGNTIDKGRRVLAIAALGVLIGYGIAMSLPTGKPGATPTITESPVVRTTAKTWGPYERPTFRHLFAKGAAANTSIYCPGITINSDQILEAWTCDSTKMAGSWLNVSDSTYITATDSIKCGLSTAAGPVFLFWYDAP